MSPVELKVITETLPSSRIAAKIEVPAKRCKASYEEALSRLSRSVKLPGFRKGKVPKAVLMQQIGVAQIKATALESLVKNVWQEAIKQESIEPLCEPVVSGGFESLFESFEPDQNLLITLETDVIPEPKLKKVKGLQAEAEVIAFDPLKVDELIEESRKQLATLVPVEKRAAKVGDVAVLSFQGTYIDDGSEIEGGNAESMDIDLEKGRMIPGFVEGIIGMNLNDEKTIECQFPDDYSQEDARGRKASFLVKLKDLKVRELPELNDSFAQQASDKETIAELKQDLEKRLKDDAQRRHENTRQEALLKALVEQLEVELPQTLIDQEVRKLVEQTASRFAQQGMDVKSMFTAELVKSLMESSQEEAKENLKQSLALNALAKAENIEVDDEEFAKKLKEVKKQIGNEKNIDSNKLQQAVEEDLLKEKIFKWLEENNTVVETSSKESSISKSKKIKPEKSEVKTEKVSKRKPKN